MPDEIAPLPSAKKANQPPVTEQTVLNFLRDWPLFQFLNDAALSEVAHQTNRLFFPKDTPILRQGDPATAYLYLIEHGGVKQSLKTEFEAEAVIEVAGEGEIFGLLSGWEDETNYLPRNSFNPGGGSNVRVYVEFAYSSPVAAASNAAASFQPYQSQTPIGPGSEFPAGSL